MSEECDEQLREFAETEEYDMAIRGLGSAIGRADQGIKELEAMPTIAERVAELQQELTDVRQVSVDLDGIVTQVQRARKQIEARKRRILAELRKLGEKV